MTNDDVRVYPHDLEAERATLGAVLVDSKLILQAVNVLQPAMFFRRAHQAIYTAMIHLESQGIEIDPVTLKTELDKAGEMAEVGGTAYIMALTDGIPKSSNIKHYAGIVREMWVRRQVIDAGKNMVDEAYGLKTDVREIVGGVDRVVVELQRKASDGLRTRELNTLGPTIFNDIEGRVNNKGQLLGITTGFESIDELTQGWQQGDMIVLAARPSVGKTAFTLNTAVLAAEAGAKVMLFSLEMRFHQLKWRLLSYLSQVALTRIMSGHLGEPEFERVAHAVTRFDRLGIGINDAAHQTVFDIRSECRRRKAEHGLDLVIVDYFQLLTGTLEGRHSRYEQLTDASRKLKILADEVEAPVIVLSQLNRGGATRSDSRPRLEDLRETGALEQDADVVGFLHRKHHLEDGLTLFIVEKQRNGPGGDINLSIARRTQTFTDSGPVPEQDTFPEPDLPDDNPAPPPGFGGSRAHHLGGRRKLWRSR